ncbi:MAG: magnesium transporter [Victivallales bacterium]|nr:magnesium transporter [Victivallales bacterium]
MTAKPLNTEEIRELLRRKQFDQLRSRLSGTDPADVADLLNACDGEEIKQIFNILDNQLASDVIVEMESDDVDEVVENLPEDRLAKLMKTMAPDDAVDFFHGLSDEEKAGVMTRLSPTEQEKLHHLSHYRDDSGGGLMTSEMCAVSGDATIKEAINGLITSEYSDPVSMVFAVDRNNRLLGSVHISDLLANPATAKVRDAITSEPVFAYVDEDQEDIARDFRKYNLYAMPVVDHNMKLVGRITVDDVMEVLDEEIAEDIAHMSGAPDIEHRAESPLRIVQLRLPWLLITMFTGMLVSLVVGKIIGLHGAAVMAAFVPVILGMGGNTGMQSTAVTVRSIALGEIHLNRLLFISLREIMVGAMMGTVCGIIAALIVAVNLRWFAVDPPHYPLVKLCLIVGISMLTSMSFAALSGTLLPIILNRLHIDPAVASGPFVSTSNDLSASLIYLGMCTVLLRI